MDKNNKLAPHALELERAILGALIDDNNSIEKVIDILKPEIFFSNAHAEIYNIMVDMYNNSEPYNLLILVEKLRNNGALEQIGGVNYLNQLTNYIEYSLNIREHSLIIYQKWMQREVIRLSKIAIQKANEDVTDVFLLLDDTIIGFTKILQNIRCNTIKSAKEIGNKIKKGILEEKAIAEEIELGICDLTTMKKTFNVIAAYQGNGKTAKMLTAAIYLSKNKIKTGIFSMEMSEEMLAARLLQCKTGINAKKILSNKLTKEERDAILNSEELTEYILINDDCTITQQNIIQKISMFIAKHSIEVLFIDYIQLIELTEGNSDVKAMENLTNKLQKIAKELNISIIALSQLSRSSERPNAGTLRGGGIEQAASDIWILFDEFHKEDNGKPWNDIPENRRGKLLLINAKARYGETENKDVYFDKPHQLMTNWVTKKHQKMDIF